MTKLGSAVAEELQRIERGNFTPPRSTTWPELDKHIGGGLRPGLYVLAGEPKSGKSALAIYLMAQMALSVTEAEEGEPLRFAYESLELSERHVLSRFLSLVSYEVPELEAFAWPDYHCLAAELGATKDSPISRAASWCASNLDSSVVEVDVRHRSGVTVGHIFKDDCYGPVPVFGESANGRSRCKPLRDSDIEAFGTPLQIDGEECVLPGTYLADDALVIVDYLQLVGVAELGESAEVYRRTNRVVRYLSSSHVPILAVSEQNRTALRSTAKNGARYGASGSGRIEYGANAVMRLELVRDEGEAGRVVALHVDLSRYGTPTGDSPIYLRYIPQYNVFMPLDS